MPEILRTTTLEEFLIAAQRVKKSEDKSTTRQTNGWSLFLYKYQHWAFPFLAIFLESEGSGSRKLSSIFHLPANMFGSNSGVTSLKEAAPDKDVANDDDRPAVSGRPTDNAVHEIHSEDRDVETDIVAEAIIKEYSSSIRR